MNTQSQAIELVEDLGDIAGRFNISREQALRIASRATNEAEFVSIWENQDWWV